MNKEPGTWNTAPGTRNLEQGTRNTAPGTRKGHQHSSRLRFSAGSIELGAEDMLMERGLRGSASWRTLIETEGRLGRLKDMLRRKHFLENLEVDVK